MTPLLLLAMTVVMTLGQAQPAKPTAKPSRTPGFVDRVLPLLTKAGCNTGTCHGAAVGQGGFKLSLLGYDPQSDYDHVVRELGGRRIHRGLPDKSLILRKATLRVAHGGGRRIEPGSAAFRQIRQWVAAGAPLGDLSHNVTSLTVSPAGALLETPGRSVRLRVAAAHSDGGTEDVTSLALYTPLDEALATVSPEGLVTLHGRGATAIMVRYRGQVAAARVAVPVGAAPVSREGWAAQNVIDEKVFSEFARLRIAPSPPAGDAQLIRRLYLDLTGALPTSAEARELLKRPLTTADRAALADRLLASSEFTDYWTYKLADLLLINRKRHGELGVTAYHAWLRRQVQQGTPLDRIARELILATGDPNASGPPNFYRLATDPRDMGEFVSRAFLGVRVQCARCHNHPFDRWTQDDYHAWAAVFAQVRQDGGRIVTGGRGDVTHPRTGKEVPPKPLGAAARTGELSDRRVLAAEMVTGPGARLFATSMANRVWKHLLGRGIVEPVDDLRPTNPPSNPALLEGLADELIRLKFDLRALIRTIVLSRTYQADSGVNETNRRDDRLFSHAYLKPLPAVVMADALAQACGVLPAYSAQAAGLRAVQLPDPQTESYTLDVLGRCPRESGCEEPGQFGGGLSQALHLVVGPAINDRLAGGIVSDLFARGAAEGEIVEELYLRTLSRMPSPAERRHWETFLHGAPRRREAIEDLLWALLNSKEFAFIH